MSVTVPSVRGFVDVQHSRVVGEAPAGMPITVGTSDFLGPMLHVTAAANGRFVAQFGINSAVRQDLSSASGVWVQAQMTDVDSFTAPIARPTTSTDVDDAEVTYHGLPTGTYDAVLQCGTHLTRVAFSATDGADAVVDGARLARGPWSPTCTLLTTDALGTVVRTSAVPQLAAALTPAQSPTTVSIVGTPGATVDLHFDVGADTEVKLPTAGTASVSLPSGASAATAEIVDSNGNTWSTTAAVGTVLPLPAPSGTVIGPDGATVGGDTFGPGVVTPANNFVGEVVRVDPHDQPISSGAAATISADGFAAGSMFAQVTITDPGDLTALDVNDLDVPIQVQVPVPATSVLLDDQLAPAWFSASGRWELVPRIAPHVLPRELDSGYWIEHEPDGSRVVFFLTRHLTEFGMLRDVKAPTWRRWAVHLARRSRTVGWAAARDNRAVTGYRVSVGHHRGRLLAPTARKARIRRGWHGRVCVTAYDAANHATASCSAASL
jgi:hypothetical protein